MEKIAALLLEPVGCLAEFRPDEFDKAARQLSGISAETSASGSRAYWRLVGLLGDANAGPGHLATLELAAVEQADLYEDVRPALEKLRDGGVQIYLVTSLSRAAVVRFVERFDLAGLVSGVVAREDARGAGADVLRHAVGQAGLPSSRCLYLADTPHSLDMAKQVGVNVMLMINDYDDGRALAEHSPVGGVVSLAELSDALQLIEQRAALPGSPRMPIRPFEMFEP